MSRTPEYNEYVRVEAERVLRNLRKFFETPLSNDELFGYLTRHYGKQPHLWIECSVCGAVFMDEQKASEHKCKR